MADVRKFSYTSKGETRIREVLVFHEDENHFDGLDLTLLGEADKNEALELLKDREPAAFRPRGSEKLSIDGFKADWNKAWRRFTKSKVQ